MTTRRARILREKAGLSLRDVEEKTGIDHAAIGKFEQGLQMLRGTNLQAYAQLLECTIDELLASADTAKEPAA